MPLDTFDFFFCQGCGRGKDKDGVGDVVGVVGASDWAGHPWLGGGAMSPSPRLWLQIINVGVRQG